MPVVADNADTRTRRSRTSRAWRRSLAVGLVGWLVAVPATDVSASRTHVVKHGVHAVKQGVVKRSGGAKARGLSQRARSVRLRTVNLSCFASFQFDFSPSLDGSTPVTSQTTAALTACLSPDGSSGHLLSGVLFADRGHSTARGCSPLPIQVDGVGSILWNDDSTSEFTFRVNTNPLAERFGLEADITGGTLAGSRISAVPVLILQDGLCGLGGVRSLAVNFGFDVFTHP